MNMFTAHALLVSKPEKLTSDCKLTYITKKAFPTNTFFLMSRFHYSEEMIEVMWCVFLLQMYSCTERTASTVKGVLKSIYSFPHIGTGTNITKHIRVLHALKDNAEGNGVINIYSHKCLGKTRCKLFRGLTQPHLPSYSQSCSFHQDHWLWSDAKKEGPDTSKKHKQMVQ